MDSWITALSATWNQTWGSGIQRRAVATSRIPIECPGCQDSLTLRIAISYEDEQDFYLVCPQCSSAIRARLMTDQSAGELTGLDLDGKPAVLVDDPLGTIVNVSTEYPMDPSAVSEESIAGSGFMMHGASLGDTFHQWRQRGAQFEASAQGGWAELRRWWGFYVREDWERFDDVARELLGDRWPDEPPMLARHDAIHRVLDGIFVPLYAQGDYVRWKMAIFHDVQIGGPETAREFAATWGSTERVGDARKRLFDVLDHFVAQRAQWRPGQLRDEYDIADVQFDPSWRLMRDDFRSLRDLFNTTFERAHQYLPVLIGFHNATCLGRPRPLPRRLNCDDDKTDQGNSSGSRRRHGDSWTVGCGDGANAQSEAEECDRSRRSDARLKHRVRHVAVCCV